jgi:hypothetical protein
VGILLLYATFINRNGITVHCNTRSKLFKLIAFFAKLINPKIYDYGITLGSSIYLPENYFDKIEDGRLQIKRDEFTFSMLAHEMQHAADARWLYLTYALPHILALPLVIIAFFLSGWWMWVSILLAIICASPLLNYFGAAYLRALAEARAYAITELITSHALNESESAWHLNFHRFVDNRCASVFGASPYYWPLPRKSWARSLMFLCAAQVRGEVAQKSALAKYGQRIREILNGAEIK